MAKLLIAENSKQAKQFSRLYKQKKIRKICHGIYAEDLKQPLEKIIQSHWMEIVSRLVSNGILSFRTAAELKPIAFEKQSIVFVTSSYAKTIHLPGLIIKIAPGNYQDYHEQVLPTIARSNRERMLLENLTVVRGKKYQGIKTIGTEGVEQLLAKELRLRGEQHLNQIRDEAKIIAEKLGYHSEYEKLNQIISALLSTHNDKFFLNSSYAKAVANKKAYDINRIALFNDLIIYLKKCHFLKRSYQYSKITFKNLSFFEAYFSNFIEGTEFVIDEAEDIVFKGVEINHRHADSHDVLANFTLTNDYSEMYIIPNNPDEFLEILQSRHAYIMKERPEKQPGKFKSKPNKAGNTYFVAPEDVIGTLIKGFELYQSCEEGLEKALFMQYLIAEVHPFDDGNGRISRIMMNAELVNVGLVKIIVPTVQRDSYLNGLRLASRDHNFRIFCKVMDQCQAYTESIDWQNYPEAREKIENDDANLTSDEGLPTFNRVLRQLKLSDFAN